MGHALDGRPLLVRLQKRIEKFDGCKAQSIVTDMTLHQQSVDEINRLTLEVALLRKRIERTQMVGDVPLLKNYRPLRDNDAQAPTTE